MKIRTLKILRLKEQEIKLAILSKPQDFEMENWRLAVTKIPRMRVKTIKYLNNATIYIIDMKIYILIDIKVCGCHLFD